MRGREKPKVRPGQPDRIFGKPNLLSRGEKGEAVRRLPLTYSRRRGNGKEG